jgi:hypothetical protein
MRVAPNCGTKVKGSCELALSSHKPRKHLALPLPPSLSLSLLRARSLSSLSLSMLIAPVALDNLNLQVFFFLLQHDTNFEIHQHNTHLGILENLKNQRKSNNNPNPKKKKKKNVVRNL